METPEELRYTEDHEWARIEGNRARIGITDFAQDSLGDVVFVQLPQVGTTVEARATLGEVESTKSVSDVYAPIGGKVVAINESLGEHPELLNTDPYGDGWICVIEYPDSSALEGLLTAASYAELTSA